MNKLSLVLVLIIAGVFVSTATLIASQRGNAVEADYAHHEFARDTAIDYLLQTHEGLGALQVPSSWLARDLTPGLVGVSNLQYIGDSWTVTVSSAVVREPIYTVEIDYTGEVSFQWKGTVDQDGNVVEMDFTVVQ